MKKGDHFVMHPILLDLVVHKMSIIMPVFLAFMLTTPVSLDVKCTYLQMLNCLMHTESICVNTSDVNVDFGVTSVIAHNELLITHSKIYSDLCMLVTVIQ